jgi:hypothetical protein
MLIKPIERVASLPAERFHAEYGRPGLPVIMTNPLRWPALSCWTHEWFRDNHGDVEVELSCNPTHTHRVAKMRLGTYMQRVIDDDRMSGGLYLDQFSPGRIPGLAKYFSTPAYCNPDRQVMPHLWLGPGTTVLSFHKDNHSPLVQIDNIFVQIRGRKRIFLASPQNDPLMYPRPPELGAYWHSRVNPEKPDLQEFPLFDGAVLLEGTVAPGDVLYIPRDYWHYVRALERSISMSFWWNPYRLMEIARLLTTEDETSLEELRLPGRLSISDADIGEIGGESSLDRVFAQFGDLELLQKLCSRLADHADEAARDAIEGALERTRARQRCRSS